MKLLRPRWFLIAGGVLLLTYLGDYISIAYRIPNGREQFGSVEVQKLLAGPQKDRIYCRSAASAAVRSFAISAAQPDALLVSGAPRKPANQLLNSSSKA